MFEYGPLTGVNAFPCPAGQACLAVFRNECDFTVESVVADFAHRFAIDEE